MMIVAAVADLPASLQWAGAVVLGAAVGATEPRPPAWA